jgi:hypothetical protein
MNIGKSFYVKNHITYCSIDKNNEPFIINISGTVVKNENDYIYIKINNTLIDFIDELKKYFIKHVLENSKKIYGMVKSIDTVTEFYCNPVKSILVKSKYIDVLKCKCDNKTLNGYIHATVEIDCLWFSRNSFGPQFKIKDIKSGEVKKCMFLEDDISSDDEFKN